jgi:hypothetical protein
MIHFPGVVRSIKASPWDQYPSDMWLPPCMDVPIMTFGAVILVGFSVSLLFSWNFYFPTSVEKTMWRAITAYQSCFGVAAGIWYLVETIRWHRDRRNETPLNSGRSIIHSSQVIRRSTGLTVVSIHSEENLAAVSDVDAQYSKESARGTLAYLNGLVQPWRNISVDKDPGNAIPIRLNFPLMIMCIIYIFGRLFVYVEDFMSLRCQPTGVYISVNRFVPFLG